MTLLTAQWIDNGIMIIAAFLLLRFYFKPEAKHLYKKKWVLVACGIMILYSIIEIGLAYREHSKTRIPPHAEIEQTVLANGTLTEADLVYRSPHGYSILVPKGYIYTHFTSSQLSLSATRDTNVLIVARQPCSDPLSKMVSDTCRYLKQKNPTYTFSDQQSITIGETPAIRLGVVVTNDNVQIQGLFLFFKKDNDFFQMLCRCPVVKFAESKKQFELIINSLTLR